MEDYMNRYLVAYNEIYNYLWELHEQRVKNLCNNLFPFTDYLKQIYQTDIRVYDRDVISVIYYRIKNRIEIFKEVNKLDRFLSDMISDSNVLKFGDDGIQK
eukprot:gene1857-998_t